MSKVRIKDTDIERILGKTMMSFWKIERYKKNVKNLPGKPDIVFPKSKIAIFADGDFWHGKDFEKWKPGIPLFWQKKITDNIQRDRLQTKMLRKIGYKVFRFYGSRIKRSPEYIRNSVKRAIKQR